MCNVDGRKDLVLNQVMSWSLQNIAKSSRKNIKNVCSQVMEMSLSDCSQVKSIIDDLLVNNKVTACNISCYVDHRISTKISLQLPRCAKLNL